VNITRILGIKADFSGHYGTPITFSPQIQMLLQEAGITGLPPSVRSYSYLFGPVVSQNMGRYKPFAHALFGANSVGTNLSGISVGGLGIPGLTVSDTAFAMAFGGGIDVKLQNRLSLRVGQIDYLFTKHNFSFGTPGVATHQNNYRASAGIVFQFGGTHVSQTIQPRLKTGQHPNVSAGAMLIPTLGVHVAFKDGVQITDLAPNGPGSAAGLRPGDFITAVDGVPVKTPEALANALSGMGNGSKVQLRVMIRGMWQSDVTVVIDDHK
jgi:hypothetical protein